MTKLTTMKAAIFDMDGTLIDSMPNWRALNVAFARAHGIEPTEEEQRDMYSLSGTQVVTYFEKKYGLSSTFDELCDEACRQMESVYAAGVAHKPGALAYLKRLRARGVKCVVATATPARLALIALNTAGLTGELDYIFSTDMIGSQKSQPDFFDRLCDQISEEKTDCVMFEDALYAMRGARAAGLGVVGITDSTNVTDRQKILEVCDIVIDSYDELG